MTTGEIVFIIMWIFISIQIVAFGYNRRQKQKLKEILMTEATVYDSKSQYVKKFQEAYK